MGRSQRLRLRELRELYLLVGECRELRGDAIAWRDHLLKRMQGIFGACLTYTNETTQMQEAGAPVTPADHPEFVGAHFSPFPSKRSRELITQFAERGEPNYSPFYAAMAEVDKKLFTRARRQVVPDGRWYRSDFYCEVMRPMEFGDMMTARFHWGHRHIEELGMNRMYGERGFSERERKMLHLLFRELIVAQQQEQLPRFGTSSIHDLPPRLREVLSLLMQGQSEKEIARELGISPHTVRDHVKRLHQHFRVRSRGELLARCRHLRVIIKR